MADTKRLAMLKALSAHLEAEVGCPCSRGRLFFTDEDELPMLSILDDFDPDRYPRRAGANDGNSPGEQAEQYVILVQGWAEDDKKNPTDPAHNLMGLTKKALHKIIQTTGPFDPGEENPSYKLGGLVEGLRVEPGTVRPPQEQASEKAFFWLRLVVTFTENNTDPFDLN